MLTLREVSLELGLSVDTIRRMVKAREIRSYQFGKQKQYRIAREDLERYKKSCRLEPLGRM